MGSVTVDAQKLANESNEKIAKDANDLNYKMMNEQNQWNLDVNRQLRDEERAYNDPSAQMDRLIKAGINPIMAAGQLQDVNPIHVEGVNPPQAQTYEFQPEYDPFAMQRVGNIMAAGRDIMNAGFGLAKYAQQEEALDIQRNAQLSKSDLERATAAEVRESTVGRNLSNQWTIATLGSRIHQESQKVQRFDAELRKLDASTELYRSKKLEADESKKLISENINSVIASIRQRDKELSLLARNVAVNERNAMTNEYNSVTNRKNFELADERFTQELKKWSNDHLMQFMYRFGKSVSGEVDGGAKFGTFHINGKAGINTILPADLAKMRACGIEIYQRAADNPTPENLKAAEEISPLFNEVDTSITNRMLFMLHPFDADTSNSSVLNPSGF